MADITPPEGLPRFLTKHGITRLEDNLEPGQPYPASPKLFLLLFREELIEAMEMVKAKRTEGGSC